MGQIEDFRKEKREELGISKAHPTGKPEKALPQVGAFEAAQGQHLKGTKDANAAASAGGGGGGKGGAAKGENGVQPPAASETPAATRAWGNSEEGSQGGVRGKLVGGAKGGSAEGVRETGEDFKGGSEGGVAGGSEGGGEEEVEGEGEDDSARCRRSGICEGTLACQEGAPEDLGCVLAAGERQEKIREAMRWSWKGYRYETQVLAQNCLVYLPRTVYLILLCSVLFCSFSLAKGLLLARGLTMDLPVVYPVPGLPSPGFFWSCTWI